MSKPRVVRRATWRELRVLVTTANGPQLLEHVDHPNVYWARNCSDLPCTVEDVPLLHTGAAGRAVPLHVAWEHDTGAVSSFAAIPQQGWCVWVRRQVHARGHCGHFLLEHDVPSGGVVDIVAARPSAVAGHRQCAAGVPRGAAPSAGRLGLVQSLVRLQRVSVQGNLLAVQSQLQ